MQKTIHSSLSQLIVAKLIEMRKKAKLTQRELAKKLSREHSLISRIELGERRVDIAEFLLIAQACELNITQESRALINDLVQVLS